MARILIGWELGGNRGHISRILPIADALSAEGHEVALALQNPSLVPPHRLASYALYQAPIWPGLVAGNAPVAGIPAASMGDILARLGLAQAATLPAMLSAWHAIFAAFRPQLVIGDFAPVLTLAARQRVPLVTIGTGFTQPPAEMEFFPSLSDRFPAEVERDTLDAANAGLALIGEPGLAALPEMFAAETRLVSSPPELDAYADFRTDERVSPFWHHAPPEPTGAGGDEVFVYAHRRSLSAAPLWDGLQQSGLPVRVHIADLSKREAAALADRGFQLEAEPLPIERIAERSRCVLTHGGHGLVCAALFAGLPQIAVHYDLEKACNGRALAAHTLGGHVALEELRAEPFARTLTLYHAADEPHRRCREAAHRLHAGLGESPMASLMAMVEQRFG